MLLMLTLLLSKPAFAYDQWIEPRPTPAGVQVHLRLGEHLTGVEPFLVKDPGRYSRFALYSSAGVRDLHTTLLAGADPAAVVRLRPEETGTLLLALDGQPKDIELEAAKFDAYLAEEGLEAVRAARAGLQSPAHERYSRTLKAIFANGAPDGEVATTAIGQELELVPVTDPLRAQIGEPWRVTVIFRGQPLPGVQILAARRAPDGEVTTHLLRTDAAGVAAFALDGPGDWIVRLVHMLPSEEQGAEWRSWWTSLTFSR